MKTKSLISLTKKIGLALFVLILAFTVDSCATKAMFLSSSVVPAAQGYVTVSKGSKNHNYMIQVKVSNLAPVNRLQPPAETYIVWMNTNDGRTRNIGRIDSGKGGFSNLKASLKTVSSYKPVKVFITAENTDNMSYPSGQVVLTTDNL